MSAPHPVTGRSRSAVRRLTASALLAVGAPLEAIGDIASAGAVSVVYGSERSGLSRRDDFWSQGTAGLKGHPEAFDAFGAALTVGDFDGDDFGSALGSGAPGG